MSAFDPSGDLLADRRYAYARAAREEGDLEAAADLMAQALELAPRWASGWFELGEIEEARGGRDAAIAAFERARALDPHDKRGAGVKLAALGAPPTGEAMTSAYVAALFDQYAPRFDAALREGLDYRGPEILLAAILAVAGPRARFTDVLDLGCGTGLMAEALGTRAGAIIGVDLSSAMAAIARRRGYARVETGDLVDFLADAPEGSADLVVAADVFVYLGDLAPALQGAFRALRPGGLLGFSVQDGRDVDFAVGADMRFGHGEAYLRRALSAAGFAEPAIQRASTRRDRGEPTPGLIVVVEKPREFSARPIATPFAPANPRGTGTSRSPP